MARIASLGANGHRYHHRAVEGAGRRRRDRCPVHRHLAVELDMAQAQACTLQRLVERERAAQHECHQVRAPAVEQIGWLGDQLAMLEHAVCRHIGADVDVAEFRQVRIAGLGHADQRAGLGVAQAEAEEVGGEVGGEDRDIALRHARGLACGVASVLAAADFLAKRLRLGERRGGGFSHGRTSCSGRLLEDEPRLLRLSRLDPGLGGCRPHAGVSPFTGPSDVRRRRRRSC